jgi:hypothetical protein
MARPCSFGRIAPWPMPFFLLRQRRICRRAPGANRRRSRGKTFAPQAERLRTSPSDGAKRPAGLLAFPSEQAGILGTAIRPYCGLRTPASRAGWCAFGPAHCAFPSALGPKVFKNLVCVSTAGSSREARVPDGFALEAGSGANRTKKAVKARAAAQGREGRRGIVLGSLWRAPAAMPRCPPRHLRGPCLCCCFWGWCCFCPLKMRMASNGLLAMPIFTAFSCSARSQFWRCWQSQN